MSYEANPPLASMLTAREIPASGGSTWFCDMIGAYADMPDALKQRIAKLKIKHDGTYNSAGLLRAGVTPTDDPIAAPGTLHPAVIRIPESNDLALYLGRRRMSYASGLTLAESETLLDELWQYPVAPNRVYKHNWQIGDPGTVGQPHHHASPGRVPRHRAPAYASHTNQGEAAPRPRS